MTNNLKVDIIYYKTNPDFEMEFNMCGICRMRLLTDKAENTKDFFNCFKRAIERSGVIICCGSLYNNNDLVKIISDATGIETERYSTKKQVFQPKEGYLILKDSIQLRSSNGTLGGCIVERGDQALVVLTDDKSLRKTIVNEFVFPYISKINEFDYANNANEGLTKLAENKQIKKATPKKIVQDNPSYDKERLEMLNSAEIRNIKFSKVTEGYNQEEVDVFLDKVEGDYNCFEYAIKERETQIAILQKKISSIENSKENKNAELLSGQRKNLITSNIPQNNLSNNESKCAYCNETWTSSFDAVYCPFCGEKVNIKSENLSSLSKGISFVVLENGIEIFNEPKRFLSLIMDFVIGNEKEKNLLRIASNCGILNMFIDIKASDKDQRILLIKKAVKKLEDDAYLSTANASYIISLILDGIDVTDAL